MHYFVLFQTESLKSHIFEFRAFLSFLALFETDNNYDYNVEDNDKEVENAKAVCSQSFRVY